MIDGVAADAGTTSYGIVLAAYSRRETTYWLVIHTEAEGWRLPRRLLEEPDDDTYGTYEYTARLEARETHGVTKDGIRSLSFPDISLEDETSDGAVYTCVMLRLDDAVDIPAGPEQVGDGTAGSLLTLAEAAERLDDREYEVLQKAADELNTLSTEDV